MIHPFIIAELALGSLKERAETHALLDLLPQARVAQLWTRDKQLRKVAEALGIHAGLA